MENSVQLEAERAHRTYKPIHIIYIKSVLCNLLSGKASVGNDLLQLAVTIY
jgi:hypothetical protein